MVIKKRKNNVKNKRTPYEPNSNEKKKAKDKKCNSGKAKDDEKLDKEEKVDD